MTKLKKITLRFKEPLTKVITYQGQEVQIEAILFTDLDGVKANLKKELSKVLKGIDIVRKIGLNVFQILEMRVGGIIISMDGWLCYKRDDIDPCVYYIYYPMSSEALLAIKDIGSKFKLFGLERILKGRDIEFARIFQEKKFIKSLRLFSFKEMQIDPDGVEITSEEVEGEPIKETKEEVKVEFPIQPPAPIREEQKETNPTLLPTASDVKPEVPS